MAPQSHPRRQGRTVISNRRQNKLARGHGSAVMRHTCGKPNNRWRRTSGDLTFENVNLARAVVERGDPPVVKGKMSGQLTLKALARQRGQRLLHTVVVVMPIEMQARIRDINATFVTLNEISQRTVMVSIHPRRTGHLDRPNRFSTLRIQVENLHG